MAHKFSSSNDDPLTLAMLPPEGETPKQKAAREADEAAAKKVSDNIDAMLKEERQRKKVKAKKEVKMLLLGQSESGKSTCLKQFQILYAPNQFAQERASWKAVIYLNLVKSVRKILDALAPETDQDDGARPETPMSFNALDSQTRTSSEDTYAQFSAIKLRLAPLTLAEDLLFRQLAGEGEVEATQLGNWNKPSKNKMKEVFVRSGANWKKSLSNGRISAGESNSSPSSSDSGHGSPNDPFQLVRACAQDMAALWGDPNVRDVLRRKKIRLQESSGFFLNDIQRLTAKNYVPSNQDVLSARLKTLGVVEHHFALDRGGEKGYDWYIYDVGGHRDQRQIWASFFDDVNAIIFLAPISAFDQVLTEDARINRIEDSLILFRGICSNKLLSKVNIVLFLNKIDILQAKLKAGAQFNKYVHSYGDRPNDYDNVARYFRAKFGAVHSENSPNPGRELYIHFTTVTDTETTVAIITDVREMLLRKHLQNSSLI